MSPVNTYMHIFTSIFSNHFTSNLFREHVDLKGFLDYEIWKASHMLAQNIPLQKIPHPENELWEDFGPHWCSDDVAAKT